MAEEHVEQAFLAAEAQLLETMLPDPTLASSPTAADLDKDELHDAVVKAWLDGARSVHKEWAEADEEERRYLTRDEHPDFTEAAHDFAASLDVTPLDKDAEIVRLVAKVAPMFPITTSQSCPDYADVHIGDGVAHSSQAMTMNPDHWDALNELFAALTQGKD